MQNDSAPDSPQAHFSAQLRRETDRQRRHLLTRVSRLLDRPMTALSLVWLVLLVLDFTQGLSAFLEQVNLAIWGAFIVHFALELTIAPDKLEYLRRNWLTAVALVLPALRVLRVLRAFRLLRAARVIRSLSLLRLVTSLNRGMRALGRATSRQGLGYVLALTLLINFAGAAGMYTFENPAALRQAGYAGESRGLTSYGEAMWWTAMMLTTMGSEYWPKTTEGRIVCLLLAVYAFAIFGYITATVAGWIIRSAVPAPAGSEAPAAGEWQALRDEMAALRLELQSRG